MSEIYLDEAGLRRGRGECYACGKVMGNGTVASRHLHSCVLNRLYDEDDGAMYAHVLVKGGERHWMDLLVSADATLGDVDKFLRDTWLECCGHLSGFRFGEALVSVGDDDDELSEINGSSVKCVVDMDSLFCGVVLPGFWLKHEYDFGDTSETWLGTLSWYLVADERAVLLLARNVPLQGGGVNSPRDGADCFDGAELLEPKKVMGSG